MSYPTEAHALEAFNANRCTFHMDDGGRCPRRATEAAETDRCSMHLRPRPVPMETADPLTRLLSVLAFKCHGETPELSLEISVSEAALLCSAARVALAKAGSCVEMPAAHVDALVKARTHGSGWKVETGETILIARLPMGPDVETRKRDAQIAREWAKAYPLEVFPWPSTSSDGIAAYSMRHAAEQIARNIEEDAE